MRRTRSTSMLQVAVAALIGFAGVFFALSPDRGTSAAQAVFGSFGVGGCTIKGNVSISSGERIYHLPGQRYYAETVIRPEYGERYFCSESQARAAGWRRSGV
jgi:hypothetical protein